MCSHRVFYVFLTLCIALVSFSFYVLYLLYAGGSMIVMLISSERDPLSRQGALRGG